MKTLRIKFRTDSDKRITESTKGKYAYRKLMLVALVSLFLINAKAQDSTWVRKYSISLYNQNDLRNSSDNGIAAYRAISDGFRKGVKPLMNEKLGNAAYGVFNFASTYMLLIWSHEFGHSFRADQVGGHFKIHDAGLPIPYTTMHLPDDISLADETLAVNGGFEVNYSTVRTIQREFISQNGIYNEDLGYAFAHRLMYPLYTSVIVPMDPKDPEVWKNTAGDPAFCALLTFKNYSGNKVFMGSDSTVNPELVDFYQQSSLLGTFFNLLDPQFYREVGGSFGDATKTRRPIFLLGDHNTGWTYGTLFNVSPLGYELYMNNYLHVNGNKFSFYMKYGNPYKNNGFGVGWQNIIERPELSLSAFADIWDQDIYGAGISAELEGEYRFSDKLGVNLNLGYKTKGYVLGKQIDSGVNLGFGLSYYASYGN